MARERNGEGARRAVADAFCDLSDTAFFLAQQPFGEGHAPCEQIFLRRTKSPALSVTASSSSTLAVTQAMLPLIRASKAGCIVNVSSGLGSLAENATKGSPNRQFFSPGYAASKTALNAITLAFAIELEAEGIKVNAVSPGFTRTHLNGFEGIETLEDGAREIVRVAMLGHDAPSGGFTRWENKPIPW